jgi:hypothetical protein
MKRFIQSIAAVALAGLVLAGCQSDKVSPQNGKSNTPNLAGALGDPHPMLETLCQSSDTLWLYREDNGSPMVDKCFGYGGVPVACNPAVQMKWGGIVINEGYKDSEGMIDCNYWMAPGWFCNNHSWEFAPTNSFQFDQNGIPVVGNDWASQVVNPVANKWQLRIATADLPAGEFDMALRIGAVKLNLFGATVAGSATTLWGRNADWNKTGDKDQSNSQWVMHFETANCMTPATPVETSCVGLFTAPTVNSCATISANTTGLTGSTFSYAWSTGASTKSISVCPTTTTTYSVTISGAGGAPMLINEITVNAVSAACGNGNNAGQKVKVCHRPPGNPTNVQNICIDPSALPAHVARFRAPGSNPHQGHDSGCEIGECGANPCL